MSCLCYEDQTPLPLDANDYTECNYDKDVIPLYQALEDKAWVAVNEFLHTGYWPGHYGQDDISPAVQAATWVTRYEKNGRKVRWSQLPIHAAIIFGAPSIIIQQLLLCFPSGVKCTDDAQMLPLHLAFRHGATDPVLAALLDKFPGALHQKGKNGKFPVDCAKNGPLPERAFMIESILTKHQKGWEKKKASVNMKELYAMKEMLNLKTQMVFDLEAAMGDIQERENQTKHELENVMDSLKDMKRGNSSKKVDENLTIDQLVAKLDTLDKATKDLISKEKKAKSELKITLNELDDINVDELSTSSKFSKDLLALSKVESKEINNVGFSFQERSKTFDMSIASKDLVEQMNAKYYNE